MNPSTAAVFVDPNLEASMVSALLGVQPGSLIDAASYDSAGNAIGTAFGLGTPSPADHAVIAMSAWTNLGYRSRSAGEHREAFSGLFDDEPAASHEQRYEQSKHFFGFVINAVAAAESLTFAVYVAALGKAGVALSDKLLKVSRTDQIKEIKANSSFAVLGQLLEDRLRQVDNWWSMRDVLMHRGHLVRTHYVGGPNHLKSMLAGEPKTIPSNWINDFEFNAKSCDCLADWLADLISDVAPSLEKSLT